MLHTEDGTSLPWYLCLPKIVSYPSNLLESSEIAASNELWLNGIPARLQYTLSILESSMVC
ncbi:hypothetical protein WG66_012284 [Moniliophthora roreri]|nr:hypothetical protein WG66_012284 [Moniliophthora roreri]